MSSVAEAERQTMQCQVEHTFCRGTGIVKESRRVPIKKDHARHIRDHSYRQVRDGQPFGGEECDCKFTTKTTERQCVGCAGKGYQIITLTIPKPGDKVNVRDRALLAELFGDEMPDKPGVVYEVQGPEDHEYEMQFGLAIQVTWDRLKKDGSIPKTGATLWAFDLAEIRVVTK